MFFIATENFIFVADDTIEQLLTADDSDGAKRKLIKYQLERNDDHKIYLPPSVLEILKENKSDEQNAQIENLFDTFGSTKTGIIFQEVCLTGEWLKGEPHNRNIIIFITSREKFHRPTFISALKEYGFSAVWKFDKLALLDSSS